MAKTKAELEQEIVDSGITLQTTAAKLKSLEITKGDLKTAINAKGGGLVDEPFREYVNALDDIATSKILFNDGMKMAEWGVFPVNLEINTTQLSDYNSFFKNSSITNDLFNSIYPSLFKNADDSNYLFNNTFDLCRNLIGEIPNRSIHGIGSLIPLSYSRDGNLVRTFTECNKIKILHFDTTKSKNIQTPCNFTYLFAEMDEVEVLDGIIDFENVNLSSYAYTGIFQSDVLLREARFANIKYNISLSDSPLLSQETILSIAYALDNSAHTLTLNDDQAIIDKLNVNCKLNATNDGLVTCLDTDPDTLGDVRDYIINKGWTIAQ